MNRDDIIRMAREALKEEDGEDYYDHTHKKIYWWGEADAILKFAASVAAAEREECVKAVRTANYTRYASPSYVEQAAVNREQAVEAIRARGKE